MKKIIIILIAIISAGFLRGQIVDDILLFNQENYGGTARSVGMAGSFGSLGGDFSSLSLNPAGIGVYRSGEFTFSPGVMHSTIDSKYYGNTTKEQKYKMSIDNIGWIGSYSTGKESGITKVNLGFGYNKLADFNNNYYIKARNPYSSLVDYFTDQAYAQNVPQENLDPDMTGPAYDAYLLDLDSFNVSNNIYFPYIWFGDTYTHPGTPPDAYTPDVLQRVYKNTKGRIGEWVFSGGFNYNDKLYVGGTFGINKFSYTETYKFHEYDDLYKYTGNDFDYITHYNVEATGYTLKTGIIARPIPLLRLGAAIHFPTFYYVSDDSYTDINSYVFGTKYSANSTTFYNDYRMITPFKFIGSVGVQLKELGVINVDWETIDYSNTQVRDASSDQALFDLNDTIAAYLSRVNNIRIGGEIRIKKIALRAGYALYGSGFKSGTINTNNTKSIISAGLGIRNKHSFLDLGYFISLSNPSINLYPTDIGDNIATNSIQKNKFVATIGFRF